MENMFNKSRRQLDIERIRQMSLEKLEFSPLEVKYAVEELMDQEVISTPVHKSRGLGNENWFIETEVKKYLCKIGPSNAPVSKWRAAANANKLAVERGLPVPKIVVFDEQNNRLGRVVRVYEFIDGQNIDDIGGVSKVQQQFWTEFGTALRQLHEINIEGFSSRLDSSVPSFNSWDAYLKYRIPQIHARVGASCILDEAVVSRFWEAINKTACSVASVIKPALTHRDLHIDNVLFSPDGGLAAILDFDQAEAWDPVADFFKLQYFVFVEAPGSELAFTKTYGTLSETHTYFEERLSIVSGIELVNIIANEPYSKSTEVDALICCLQEVAHAAGWPDPT